MYINLSEAISLIKKKHNLHSWSDAQVASLIRSNCIVNNTTTGEKYIPLKHINESIIIGRKLVQLLPANL